MRGREVSASLIAVTLALTGCGGGTGKQSGSSQAAGPPATSAASTAARGPYGASSGGAYSSSPGGASSSGRIALIATKRKPRLGTILAYGPKRLTVYLFEADTPGRSHCTGACARVWPPVTGSPQALAGALPGDLGTITRPDGTRQVTYRGHPLYLYVQDKDSGDAYGEGIRSFGAEWYALSPSGEKVDRS